MNKDNKNTQAEEVEILFQEAMSRLQYFHNEKLELIKKFRKEHNLEELNKIRQSLKEPV